MKKIPLSQGKFAIVDDNDFEDVNRYKWYFNNGYAVRGVYVGTIDGKSKTRRVYMHKFILGSISGMVTDHVNRDSLDNRKSNLRHCTIHQNGMNQKINRSNNKSGFRGVYKNMRSKKWTAVISIKGQPTKHIGNFETPELASKAYNRVAEEAFGEFAVVN